MRGSKCLVFFIACTVYSVSQTECATRSQKGRNYRCKSLNDGKMKKLALLSEMDEFKRLLDPMLIVRVPDTEGNRQVQRHIISHMESYKWEVQKDKFQSDTPLGKKTFTNIIATLNPEAPYRFVLACHFDSKKFDFEFIGATDSAVPCAMMLDIARTMNNSLHRWAANNQKAKEVGFQFVFFDGEEAFVNWTPTDSIYGARHLAEKWGNTITEEMSHLDRITAFVLLDLIGTKKTQFRNWFDSTNLLYERLHKIEQRMRKSQPNLLEGGSNSGLYFSPMAPMNGGIEDDHIPFLRRNVPILHLISFPFPAEWHKASDNERALDFTTIDNINKILRVFVAEFLHLTP